MRIAEQLRFLIGPTELLHERAGPRLLRYTRMGVFALWIFKLLLDPLWRLAELPRELFRPVGILALLPAGRVDGLFRAETLTLLLVGTLVMLVLALANRAFPITSLVSAILLTIYSCLVRGFGPSVHTDIVALLAVYALCAFSWADFLQTKFSRAKSVPATWSSYPMITLVVLLCVPYMIVGFSRVIGGGFGVFVGHSMENWCLDASLRGYYFNTNIGWHVPEWPLIGWMLRLGLPGITVFEIAAPLCLVSSHFRWLFIPTMLSFHLLSLVFMNIFFFDDMLFYLLLVDWSRRFPSLSSRTVEGAPSS